MSDLANTRIVVTGGSEGLGLAMVEALTACGAKVTAIARDAKKLVSARRACADTIAGDATDAALIDRVVADVDPNVLILNAGARLPMEPIDRQTWEGFSSTWDTDVKGTLAGIQAALRTPMKSGGRILIMSSGAAMVISHPHIEPDSLRLSGGYIGAKRMQWFMAYQANAVSRERGLGLHFQVLVPGQLMAGTALGRAVASAYAEIEGVTVDEHILRRYGAHLHPARVGEQVARLLADPAYANGVAYGFRAGSHIMPLDQ